MLPKRLLCAVLAVSVVTLPACSTQTRIITEPEGAQITVNGFYIGDSPDGILRGRSGLPDTAYITIEKEGYEPIKNGVLEKTYRADLSLLLLIPGIIPYFFSARYEDEYRFTLRRKVAPAANESPEASARSDAPRTTDVQEIRNDEPAPFGPVAPDDR